MIFSRLFALLCNSIFLYLSTFAGHTPKIDMGEIFFVTTEPTVITHPSPISAPAQMKVLAPIQQFSPIVTF